MNFFEKLLEKKVKEEDTLDYYTQWCYDKELYIDILNGVRDYYLNYTDHSQIHSETILNNILRLFGKESFEFLSSFDIWLLLEASYLHDCGMCITREEAMNVLKEESFIEYLIKVSLNSNDYMHKYVSPFNIDKFQKKIFYKETEYDINNDYGIRFLISAYKRREHSKDFVKNINFNNKILPNRIYLILSLIAAHHTQSFFNVLNLPKKENGIGADVGHPIFITMLLRMGDLLDIDNNRFSPMLINSLKSIMPLDSLNHMAKHKAISHFWIDKEKIEITATIDSDDESYNIAEITGEWFSLIENEYKNQLYHWKNIVPENFNFQLPTLGDLNINLTNYDYIDSKNKPKFSVDINNILKLLTGTSIYDKKEKALRELIQNAVDATYLRVFEEKSENTNFENELSYLDVKEIFKDFEITIRINKIEKPDSEYNYWNISIEDKGIGIDKEHLKYILEAGSSYKDYKKKIIIEKMPYWLRPSGNFGIGFQSIFMLTDKVNIKSKFLYNHKCIDVKLLSPSLNYNNAGNIFFKKTTFDYKQKIGTTLSFVYKTSKVASSYSSQEGGFTYRLVERFDPLIFSEFDAEIFRIMDYIEEINKTSLVNINLIKDNVPITMDKSKIEDKHIFSPKEKFQVFFEFDPNFSNSCHYNHRYNCFLFKNQWLDEKNTYKYLKYYININGFNANEVLEINRDKIKKEFLIKESNTIFKSICLNLKKYIVKFSTLDDSTKLNIALFISHYEDIALPILKKENQSSNELGEHLAMFKNFLCEYKFPNNFVIKEVLKMDEIIIEYSYIKNNHSYKWKLNNKDIANEILKMILAEIINHNNYIIEYSLKKEDNGKINLKNLKNLI
nr:ATP-binding protein [Fusobacterium gastrosuis]